MSQFNKNLQEQKKEINTQIDKLFQNYKKEYNQIGSTTTEALERLQSFAKGGKGVRGVLFMITSNLFGNKKIKHMLDIAASLEILQASLLIHDDIMDNDFLRRGNPSLFAQYIPTGEKLHAKSPEHYGKSMAICIGDVGFFIAMDICNKAIMNHPRQNDLLSLLHKELITVGLAQMDDVTFGSSQQLPSIDEVLRLYSYKTAHYTFSLPFSLGALYTNMPAKTINIMDQLGEEIGLLFQIIDDQLGVFQNESISGKPLGSDIRENKKTIIRLLLEKKINDNEKDMLISLQQKDKLTQKEVNVYLDLIDKYQIVSDITDLVDIHKKKAESLLSQLDIDSEKKVPLYELISFVITRSS